MMSSGLTGGAHLSYCTNVHPGETWPDVQRHLQQDVAAVKHRVCPSAPFGVGLRLSAQATRALGAPAEIERLKEILQAGDLYVFSLNGFPHGQFHEQPVKERVYRPDWLEDERLAYTSGLARVLAAVLPEGCKGSISTVPGCFRERAAEPSARLSMARRMLTHLVELWRIEQSEQRHLVLALEPEPHCFLETTLEAVQFIEGSLLDESARQYVARATGLGESQAEALVRRHLGVCLDVCHAAVEFEDVGASLQGLKAHGIQVAKAQLSSALRLKPSPEALASLAQFDDSVYLHQVVVRHEGRLTRVVDLPFALADASLRAASAEWRVHFHVPIFLRDLGIFSTTQDTLVELIERQRLEPFTDQLEVETYTWNVLPPAFRLGDVHEGIAREIEWVVAGLADSRKL